MQTVASTVILKSPPFFPPRSSKDFPVVPRSTVRQRACPAGSPFSGEGRGLRGSPEAVGSPYSCESGLNSGSPQELLSAAPPHYILPHPHLQHGQQSQVYHCTKRKGRRKMCVSSISTLWTRKILPQAKKTKRNNISEQNPINSWDVHRIIMIMWPIFVKCNWENYLFFTAEDHNLHSGCFPHPTGMKGIQ